MKLEITTTRPSDGMGKPKDQYEILVKLDGNCFDLSKKGFQKFYKGVLKGKDSEESFLLGLEQRCNLESKIVVADDSTKIRACEAEENSCLRSGLKDIETRYFIVTRNEWVSSSDRFDFYRGGKETQYKQGTPVERLRQAAFDTRRTGTAEVHFGELQFYYPDVELMINALKETDEQKAEELEDQICETSRQIRKGYSSDGLFNPRLTIQEADKVAKLFEEQADLIEPYWKKVEQDYEKNRGNEK